MSLEQCGQSGGDSVGNLRRASGRAGEWRRRTGKGKKRKKHRVEKVGAGHWVTKSFGPLAFIARLQPNRATSWSSKLWQLPSILNMPMQRHDPKRGHP